MSAEQDVCSGTWAARKRTFRFNKRKESGKRIRVTITVEDEDAKDCCDASVVDGKLQINIKSPYIEQLQFVGGQINVEASHIGRVAARGSAAVTLNLCHNIETLVADTITINHLNAINHCYAGCPNAHQNNGNGVRVHKETFNPFDDIVYQRTTTEEAKS